MWYYVQSEDGSPFFAVPKSPLLLLTSRGTLLVWCKGLGSLFWIFGKTTQCLLNSWKINCQNYGIFLFSYLTWGVWVQWLKNQLYDKLMCTLDKVYFMKIQNSVEKENFRKLRKRNWETLWLPSLQIKRYYFTVSFI